MVVRAVLVVVFVVLAGCSGFTALDTETTTVSPAPVPEHETTETETETLPPGVTATGLEDVGALARAHVAVVRNTSYTWNDSTTEVIVAENGSIVTDISQIGRVENESTYSYWTNRRVIWRDGRPRYLGNYSEFSDRTGRYVRYEIGETGAVFREVEPVEANERIGRLGTNSIRKYLDVQNATVSVGQIDGERYYEVVGEQNSFATARPIENYTVRAAIRHDGFVRSLAVSYVEGTGGQRKRVRYTFQYSDIGETTIERPDWVDESQQNPVAETESTTGDDE